MNVKDRIDHTVCEAETTCKTCGYMSYWAYGYYSREESDWKEIQRIRKENKIDKKEW